jgi:hypothetical protein
MAKDLIIVYETGDVNKLAVENLSSKFEVFIQSGDIVKGGKQDRVLAIDIILPVKSGKVFIAAFCVESGRWTKRKNEDVSKFGSSDERIVTRELKIAANLSLSQGEVWDKVGEAQKKLSANVGEKVNAAASATSLQLSLENGKVAANADEYVKKLAAIVNGKSDVIGYAFVINGEINSAEIYASNHLFKKLWPKLLKATAVEAVAELDPKKKPKEVKADAVQGFLDEAELGEAKQENVNSRNKRVVRAQKNVALIESHDDKEKVVLHKSIVKTQ